MQSPAWDSCNTLRSLRTPARTWRRTAWNSSPLSTARPSCGRAFARSLVALGMVGFALARARPGQRQVERRCGWFRPPRHRLAFLLSLCASAPLANVASVVCVCGTLDVGLLSFFCFPFARPRLWRLTLGLRLASWPRPSWRRLAGIPRKGNKLLVYFCNFARRPSVAQSRNDATNTEQMRAGRAADGPNKCPNNPRQIGPRRMGRRARIAELSSTCSNIPASRNIQAIRMHGPCDFAQVLPISANKADRSRRTFGRHEPKLPRIGRHRSIFCQTRHNLGQIPLSMYPRRHQITLGSKF